MKIKIVLMILTLSLAVGVGFSFGMKYGNYGQGFQDGKEHMKNVIRRKLNAEL